MTEFGEFSLDTYQIVKDLLEKNRKVIGYLLAIPFLMN
jgi:hypothetical protein